MLGASPDARPLRRLPWRSVLFKAYCCGICGIKQRKVVVLLVCWNGDRRLEKEAGLVSPEG